MRQQERTAKRKGWQVRDITRSLCAWAVLVTNVLVPWLTATEARIL